MALPPGTVLDGEAVIWNGGTVDFGAVQARALAARLPATYAAFDVLAHPDDGGDALAARPYTERRTVLVEVLAAIGPPLQPVLATADRGTALQWYATLQPQGGEGIVAKPGGSAYPFGGRTVWRKIRHADTTDARVVGYVGPRRRPRRLALLPDAESRPRLSAFRRSVSVSGHRPPTSLQQRERSNSTVRAHQLFVVAVAPDTP
ncbi:hypothetical protein ACFWRD_33745 [Streptomyces sindenensis]|uniref:ATP-dependent DNA ligase n=1 Tax=Streptomyces sindenensis TaxID=67363 RepID=UPI003664FBDF